jgi:enamine deaminase RidA (YjgF/YER057c/UK114 family)
MPTFLNPPQTPKPSSNYAQGVLVPAGARRLIISGQVGMGADGVLREGMEAQTEQVFDNIAAVLAAAGMEMRDLVKLVVYCTRPQETAIVREVRARKLGSHTPASTFLIVPALANPGFLIEIEGEAVRED